MFYGHANKAQVLLLLDVKKQWVWLLIWSLCPPVRIMTDSSLIKHARGLRDFPRKASGNKTKAIPSCIILVQVLFLMTNSSFRMFQRLYFDIENNLRHFSNSGNKPCLDGISCFTHEITAL